MSLFAALLLAYLLGSVSPSYLWGKCLHGIDLRHHGSGNVGATNVFRVLGKGPGVAVLFLDILKGWAAVTFLPEWLPGPYQFFREPILYPVLVGASVIAGHNWTLFLGFKGGKGVAASCGVFLALAPSLCFLGFAAWAIVWQLTRRVALGSLAASLILPIFAGVLRKPLPLIFFTLFLTISTFYTHRSNIRDIFFKNK